MAISQHIPPVTILDTSFFLRGASFTRKDVIAAVPEQVVSEVKSRVPKLQLEKLLGAGAQIRCARSLDSAKRAAENTGDLPNLSEADLGVIALAMELKEVQSVIVYTGDFGIQNVLKSLGIKFKSVEGEIQRIIKWMYKCEACEATFKKPPESGECPECGTEGMIKKVRA
nr:NOB1 family endonuclease [Candidatus Sigynarchaeota archaeon]